VTSLTSACSISKSDVRPACCLGVAFSIKTQLHCNFTFPVVRPTTRCRHEKGRANMTLPSGYHPHLGVPAFLASQQ
jgi:hypothetical protein